MNRYLRILKFALPYKKQIVLSIIFNILTVVFSLASITILIPVLKVIFSNLEKVQLVEYTGILSLKEYISTHFDNFILNQVKEYGIKGTLIRILSLAALLFFLKNLFRYLTSVFITFLKNVVEKDIRTQTYRSIINLPVGFFTDQKKGDIISRLTTDIVEIQWAVLSTVQRMIQDPLMIIGSLSVMIMISAKLTIFVGILLPIMGFIITRIGKSLKAPSEKAKEELANILSMVDEHITGLPIIKTYVAEDRATKIFEKANTTYFKNMNKMLYRRELSSPVSEMLGSIVIIAIVWYGSLLILDTHELTPESFFPYILLFYQIIAPAKNISNAVYDIKRGDASSKRIFALIEEENPIKDPVNPVEISELKKSIDLKNINFSYEKEKVLNNINISIPKGKTYALVGQSGSGKSTIAALLNRFYDVNEGSISIDGIDIRDIKKSKLRSMIGYITQDAILFNDSIFNNILLAKPKATLSEVIEAAKVANAEEFISKLENGYNTNIGEGGGKLSGGQKQRLTIARAILKDPEILILDEATSALDAESERLVQNALEKIMQGRTSIMIAHRLSTIMKADKIIVMKDGQIIEIGNHAELIRENGEYKKLVDLQAL